MASVRIEFTPAPYGDSDLIKKVTRYHSSLGRPPLFRQLAADIGPARMQAFLRDVDYGNADIGGEADAFWLTGDLRISAVEQVGFLTRLVGGRFGASEDSVAAIRDALGWEVAPGVVLYTKTGSGRIEGG